MTENSRFSRLANATLKHTSDERKPISLYLYMIQTLYAMQYIYFFICKLPKNFYFLLRKMFILSPRRKSSEIMGFTKSIGRNKSFVLPTPTVFSRTHVPTETYIRTPPCTPYIHMSPPMPFFLLLLLLPFFSSFVCVCVCALPFFCYQPNQTKSFSGRYYRCHYLWQFIEWPSLIFYKIKMKPKNRIEIVGNSGQ